MKHLWSACNANTCKYHFFSGRWKSPAQMLFPLPQRQRQNHHRLYTWALRDASSMVRKGLKREWAWTSPFTTASLWPSYGDGAFGCLQTGTTQELKPSSQAAVIGMCPGPTTAAPPASSPSGTWGVTRVPCAWMEKPAWPCGRWCSKYHRTPTWILQDQASNKQMGSGLMGNSV